MKQKRKDAILLSSWANPTVKSVQEGYDQLAATMGKHRYEVRTMVHEALARQGVNPRHSPSVIHAFVILNQHNRKGRVHE